MNIKINIGEVITKAWQIVWKFKVLWIFGILASCGGNNSSRFNFNGGNSSGGGSGGSGNSGQMPEFFKQFQNMQPDQLVTKFLSQYTAIIVSVIVLLCILWVVFYFLGVMGSTGLIKGASKADGGAASLSFGELWTESLPYFWRMFGLNLMVGLPFFIIVVVMLAGLGFAGFAAFKDGTPNFGTGAVFVGLMGIFFALICVISIIGIIVSMIVSQAQNAIVLEDLGVLAGFSRGWSVFRSAILTIVLIAIILGVMGGIVGFVTVIPVLVIAIPAAIGMAASSASGNFLLPVLFFGICFVAYLPVLLLLSGIIQAYIQTVWTLVYRRLTAPAAAAPEVTPVTPAFIEPV